MLAQGRTYCHSKTNWQGSHREYLFYLGIEGHLLTGGGVLWGETKSIGSVSGMHIAAPNENSYHGLAGHCCSVLPLNTAKHFISLQNNIHTVFQWKAFRWWGSAVMESYKLIKAFEWENFIKRSDLILSEWVTYFCWFCWVCFGGFFALVFCWFF